MTGDIGKLQGAWNIVALEMDGRSMGTLGASRIVVQGDRFTTLSMGATYEGVVELDEASTPKTLDMTFTAGPEKGNTSLGIYELDGDTWRICLTVTGTRRPGTFATNPGSGLALE